MLVYDITNRKSFENLDVWLKDIREYGELGTPIILVGAKTDLEEERSVSKEEGRKYAEDRNLIFCTETSAKYNSNVDEAFMLVIKGFMGAIDENHTIRGHSHSQVATPNSKKRCGVC
jgi:GTPase SAR1 family protein